MSVPEHRLIIAARALLNWRQRDLAELSGVSVNSICQFESNKTKMIPANRKAVIGALRAAGVRFTEEGVYLICLTTIQSSNRSGDTVKKDGSPSAGSSPPPAVLSTHIDDQLAAALGASTPPTGFTSSPDRGTIATTTRFPSTKE